MEDYNITKEYTSLRSSYQSWSSLLNPKFKTIDDLYLELFKRLSNPMDKVLSVYRAYYLSIDRDDKDTKEKVEPLYLKFQVRYTRMLKHVIDASRSPKSSVDSIVSLCQDFDNKISELIYSAFVPEELRPTLSKVYNDIFNFDEYANCLMAISITHNCRISTTPEDESGKVDKALRAIHIIGFNI